jgi:hypothetical protein
MCCERRSGWLIDFIIMTSDIMSEELELDCKARGYSSSVGDTVDTHKRSKFKG